MGWFKRLKDGITTSTYNKKEAPDGLWFQCPECKTTHTKKEMEENLQVCPTCGYHSGMSSEEYFELFFDGKFEYLDENLQTVDKLEFVDLKSYKDRLEASQAKTGLVDAIRVATGKMGKNPITIAAMDFKFIGGSMGVVVGEKISRAILYAIKHNTGVMIISKTGGARMMESAFSLMQMAKTSARLTQLAKAKLPYISLLTNPTTGGVSASYAMLGDINIAEPKALIGFAGPRVIMETIKKELPEGFQRSEFVYEHGFLDDILERKDLKEYITRFLGYFDFKAKA